MASPLILETARLWLRPFAPEDVDVLHRMWTEPDVRRHLWDNRIIPRERAASEVEDSIESFRTKGFGMWVIQLAGATDVSGFAGFRPFGSPPDKKELMYGIDPPLWGRAYAAEAVGALVRFAFENLGDERIYARTDPPNVASVRVMEKAGMTYLGRDYEGDIELITYVIENPKTSCDGEAARGGASTSSQSSCDS